MFDFGDEPGAASVVKLAGNFLIASALEAMAEAWQSAAEKNGIARRSVADLFSTAPCSPARSTRITATRSPRSVTLPRVSWLALGLKDIGLALETAAEAGVPMPRSLLRDRLLAGVARGRGDLDWTGLARAVSEDAGLPETVNA